MKIKNLNELAINSNRKKALLIAEAGLQAIDTRRVLKDLVQIDGLNLKIGKKKFSLKKSKRIFFVGIGKAANQAGAVFEETLGDYLTGGAVLDVKKSSGLKKLESLEGSHPLPSNKNAKATQRIINLLNGLNKEDLVIFLISGGGSSLLYLPPEDLFEKEVNIVKSLMDKGAGIIETNIVRKHLSLARGGWLAKYAYPAKTISLIFSDVPGNNIDFVASGPTCKDKTTVNDAKKVLLKYKIIEDKSKKLGLTETPKEEKYFKNVNNILALSNQTALLAMTKEAGELSLSAKIKNSHFSGEADEVGKKIAYNIDKATKNRVFLYGGESTVTMRGKGRGGRNLQLALSAIKHLKDNEMILTLASDGRDNGEFGGAIADKITGRAIAKADLSIEKTLSENNTYPLFEKIGNYLYMGYTGSNVADLIIAIKF